MSDAPGKGSARVTRRLAVMAAALVIVAGLAGCGGGSGGRSVASRPSPGVTQPQDDESADAEADDEDTEDAEDEETDGEETDGEETDGEETTPTSEPGGFDITSLLGIDFYGEQGEWARSHYGCDVRPSGATYICPSSGLMIGTAYATHLVREITLVDSNAMSDSWDKFATFTDPLPLGLRWGMSAEAVASLLEGELGPPARHDDAGSVVADEYEVSGQRFDKLVVEVDLRTGRLSRIDISWNPPY